MTKYGSFRFLNSALFKSFFKKFVLLMVLAFNSSAFSLFSSPSLHESVEAGDWQSTQVLIEKGADVNAYNDELVRPLSIVINNNDLEMAQFLIEKGADVNASHRDNHYAYGTLLHYAVTKKELELAQFLIENGADVNARAGGPFRERTPFHQAAIENDLGMAQFLIEKGADVNAKNTNNWTSLHYAIYDEADYNVNNLELIQFLVENGADINARDKTDETPFHFAVRGDNIKLAQFLIEKGADINARNEKGKTPLHEAFYHRDYKSSAMSKFLIENGGGDVNLLIDEFWPEILLKRALVKEANREEIQRLIEEGADLKQLFEL